MPGKREPRANEGECSLLCLERLPWTMLALLLAMLAAGCASAPSSSWEPHFLAKDPDSAGRLEPRDTPDPFEAANRKVFEANLAFNHAVVYPMAKAYREGLPEPARDSIEAFTTNLSEPMVLANNVLQLRLDASATTLARFITNSTLGLGGLFDVAATVGQRHQSGDLGQTLYVWGIRDSPYLVLPVFGPTNVRDGLGAGLSLLAPMGIVSMVPARLSAATSQVNAVDAVGKPIAGLSKVEMLQELEASSVDFYVMLRSISDQKRQAELQEALAQSLLSSPPNDVTTVEPGTPPENGTQPAPVGLGGQPNIASTGVRLRVQ